MRPRHVVVIALLFVACRKTEATTPPVITPTAAGGMLQHHEIRPDQLPPPFHTPSAGNPPDVVRRPTRAPLHLPPGFHITLWAADLEDPRNMALAPNNDVFVAESRAGRITILRDTNRDNQPDQRFVFADNLDPFGLAFRPGYLYVGNGDGILRFAYTPGQTRAAGQPERVASLPSGGHVTRNLIFNRDGSRMYVAVGSRSNVSDESDDPLRAAITEYDPDGGSRRTFAAGLRNPVGLGIEPMTGALWTVVNERDGLGDDLVPDFATEVRDGAFYGWPFAYIGPNEDPRRRGERPDLVARSVVPSVLIASHSAPIGMTFYTGTMFPPQYRGGAFVALHGSWNRSRRTGYKVIHIPMRNGKPTGGYDDFVAGWSSDPVSDKVWGRPAGVLVHADGSLLIADDGGNVVWRVTYQKGRRE